MTNPNTKSPPQDKVSQCYSINALSKLTGRDRRTLDKAVAGVAADRVEGGKKLYKLATVEAALKSKTAPSLRDEKTLEEIRKLRLRNDRDEGKVILRADIAQKLRTVLGRMRAVLEQKLVNELATAVSGLEPAQVRIVTKRVYDEAMQECASLSVELT